MAVNGELAGMHSLLEQVREGAVAAIVGHSICTSHVLGTAVIEELHTCMGGEMTVTVQCTIGWEGAVTAELLMPNPAASEIWTIQPLPPPPFTAQSLLSLRPLGLMWWSSISTSRSSRNACPPAAAAAAAAAWAAAAHPPQCPQALLHCCCC
eukprot:1161295-Pelagomonas_calceolata.AAC.14